MKVVLGKYKKNNRKMSVRIDDWDIWNLDHTLAKIIHPCLVKFKEQCKSYSGVDNEDLPEELRKITIDSTNIEECDKLNRLRWNYILDEMIFAFDFEQWELDWYEGGSSNRQQEGFRLFGKYYMSLWS